MGNFSINSEPASVLSENLFLLPSAGVALDLASGLGANALLLAKQGLTTQAWDISSVALRKLQQQADAHAIAIRTFTQEITTQSFSPNCFDVIVVSRFLDRSICNAIMQSLKPNGLLFYQTYTQYKSSEQGPKNLRYLLAENELLQIFSSLKLVYYRENSGLGAIRQGLRNEAQFVGQKI
ncbi:SAM-dependent methyltransferase [Methylococcaceae bacterium CS1]|nr:SAM-dependent methyltransferase [Methylococcaceae bacterium CS5]TXK99038.1 SAM-dependent methyltransferase [Methylococcaceae bacterium CS4]TXL08520.1 SAM-dependent methyltransferase [Methylococcaceae bacterium CS3]TXL09137.1 SAM-dependent methyltransferase [Methylococcaceae bacterium CS1]TXL11320.1 SAM-dependent methyltransferase [Methylococcaceae bacterium CS2]